MAKDQQGEAMISDRRLDEFTKWEKVGFDWTPAEVADMARELLAMREIVRIIEEEKGHYFSLTNALAHLRAVQKGEV